MIYRFLYRCTSQNRGFKSRKCEQIKKSMIKFPTTFKITVHSGMVQMYDQYKQGWNVNVIEENYYSNIL